MADRQIDEETTTMSIGFNGMAAQGMRLRAWALAGGLALLAFAAAIAIFGPARAQAFHGITSFTTVQSDTQAGGHPDIELHTTFNNRVIEDGVQKQPLPGTCGCDDAETLEFHFPTGFIGNPHAVPRCSLALFSAQECPAESQVGVLSLGDFFGQVPIYNMEPHPNEAGLQAFNVPLVGAPSFIVLHARTGSDYGLDATNSGIFHPLPISGVDIYMWGVPALPSHDIHRFPIHQQSCLQAAYPDPCYPPVPSNASPEPYLENPTVCGTDLTAGLDIRRYDGSVDHADTSWSRTTGCDQLSFNPSLTAQPTTKEADTAAGMDVELIVPQSQSAFVPSPSEIRATSVTLPEGVSINPNAADGKTSCTDEQGAFGTEAAAQCPEESKVGTVELDSSALPGPIDGAIYLGEPKPNDTYRIFATANGFATNVKLAGSVRPDPKTGQLVVSFQDLPQSPFQRFTMHFFGSERGLLATPDQCGTYPVKSTFTPWNDFLRDQESTSYFTIDSGPGGSPCPGPVRPFNPQLKAGTADNTGGVHTPFSLKLTRADGDQNLKALNVTMPPGFSAVLAGVPYCPEAAIAQLSDPARTGLVETATPACPVTSQIGTAVTGEGAGTHPLYTSGRVFLAGPYKGAPLSLVVSVPAVSGPYDLGTVAVRAAVFVDPATARVSAVSDSFPSIVGGIPLRMRSVLIALNRPDFVQNPTNCDPSAVNSLVFGMQGGMATPSPYFQVANCTDMGFAPKLGLRLSGQVKRNGYPAIHATLRAKPGDANIRRVAVTLPPTQIVAQEHLGAPCTRAQFAANACPPASLIGTATATTPILAAPLSGPVHLVTSTHNLPDLVVSLHGQVNIQLRGKIDSKKGGLRTTFAGVPDVPVTKFRLNLAGGKKGLIVNSRSLCGKARRFTARIAGQNGKHANSRPKLRATCGKARHRHRSLHRARKVA